MNSMTWKDASGREWTARIAISDVARIRDCGVDILDAQSLPNAFTDPLQAVGLMVEVHRKDWEPMTIDAIVRREPTAEDPRTTESVRRSMTADDFAELAVASEEVAGRSILALQASLADFLRRLGRPALASLIESAMSAQHAAEQAALAKVRDPRVQQVMDKVTSDALEKIDAELEKACS